MTAPTVLVVTLTSDELRTLVRGEVDAALAAHAPTATAPAARVTLDELARLENCSRATIRRLVSEGAPVAYVGQSPRFDVQVFREWCAERGRRGTKTKPASGPIQGVRLLSRGAR